MDNYWKQFEPEGHIAEQGRAPEEARGAAAGAHRSVVAASRPWTDSPANIGHTPRRGGWRQLPEQTARIEQEPHQLADSPVAGEGTAPVDVAASAWNEGERGGAVEGRRDR